MRLLFILLFSLSFSGCATAKFGKKFTAQQVATIQKCRHSRAQLEAFFGEPIREGFQDNHVVLTWQWADMNLSAFDSTEASVRKQQQGQGVLVAFIDSRGIVVDYAHNPSNLPRPNNQCR